MNILKREAYRPDGIFSTFTFGGDGSAFMSTLEHAYAVGDSWVPKIPNGIYDCARGTHQLHNGVPFETFEITGVAGHAGLLFHKGNFDADSEGCVLCGKSVADQTNGDEMLTSSAIAFSAFMSRLSGVDSFQLVVC